MSANYLSYDDFYDLATYCNLVWNGGYTLKEVACNAYEYFASYEECCQKGKLEGVIADLFELLKENAEDEYIALWIKDIENIEMCAI